MAGTWEKFLRFLGFGPDDEELEEEAAALADAQEEPLRRALGAGGRGGARPQGAAPPPPAPPAPGERGNVVPLGAPAVGRQPFRVLVVEPRSFDDVPAIADQLKNRRPVILNLEGLDKAVAQKILDFLNGAIYALGGETQKVASSIFFYAPPGIDIANVGRGAGASGGAYDPEEIAAMMASAPRLSLPGDRVAPPPGGEGARPAARGQERPERGRAEWDWRR